MKQGSVTLSCLLVLSCAGTAHSEGEKPGAAPAERGSARRAPAAALDPAPLDRVLSAHVRKGQVDYTALKRDRRGQKDLDTFLEQAAKMPESAPLSAWLNAYNALVIDLVLERYPLRSVMDVPGFFKALKRPIAGKPRSLDEIEHEVIRKRFKDARVHVALNCGARSCPALHDRAFREATLNADLDELARKTVQNPTHVAKRKGKLAVSAIFFWFEEDFRRDAGSVLAWIKRHGGTKYRNLPTSTELVKRDYDWTLADASR